MKNQIFNFLTKIFNEKGYNLYLVGGAPRDYLLKQGVSDFDFATDAPPKILKEMFPEGDFSFLNYGVVSLKVEGQRIDITSFRKESYTTPRKTSDIVFSCSMEEDSLRRDFTINALYMDANGKIYDFHHGVDDLKDRVIRMIGDPYLRFREDPLRILRAIRFSLQLDFLIDETLERAIEDNLELLQILAPSLVSKELKKMRNLNYNKYLSIIKKYNLDKYLVLDYEGYQGEIIDLHCDTITRMVDENQSFLSNNLHVDLNKLYQGHYLLQCFAIFINKKKANLFQRYKYYQDEFKKIIEKNPKTIKLVTTYQDIVDCRSANLMVALLTVEEGGVLEGKIENLQKLYDDGVRMMTLTWNYPNEIACPSIDLTNSNNSKKGLTSFGIEVVKKMNELGMIIDVSHLSKEGFYDVLKITSSPIVASHSNARSMCDSLRNLDDEMIKEIHKNGGVMGLNYYEKFLITDEKDTLDALIRQLKHLKKLGCLSSVSLGSDFDGISTPKGLEDASKVILLKQKMVLEGFTSKEIEGVLKDNFLRVLKNVLK